MLGKPDNRDYTINGMMMKTLLVINVLFYDAFYHKGGMTQKEICQRTFQSKQTVNPIIKNLLAENYVTVTEMPENKRNKLVQMTEAGQPGAHLEPQPQLELCCPENRRGKCTVMRCRGSIRCSKMRRMWLSLYSAEKYDKTSC